MQGLGDCHQVDGAIVNRHFAGRGDDVLNLRVGLCLTDLGSTQVGGDDRVEMRSQGNGRLAVSRRAVPGEIMSPSKSTRDK